MLGWSGTAIYQAALAHSDTANYICSAPFATNSNLADVLRARVTALLDWNHLCGKYSI